VCAAAALAKKIARSTPNTPARPFLRSICRPVAPLPPRRGPRLCVPALRAGLSFRWACNAYIAERRTCVTAHLGDSCPYVEGWACLTASRMAQSWEARAFSIACGSCGFGSKRVEVPEAEGA
jgi:hypothetical protein